LLTTQTLTNKTLDAGCIFNGSTITCSGNVTLNGNLTVNSANISFPPSSLNPNTINGYSPSTVSVGINNLSLPTIGFVPPTQDQLGYQIYANMVNMPATFASTMSILASIALPVGVWNLNFTMSFSAGALTTSYFYFGILDSINGASPTYSNNENALSFQSTFTNLGSNAISYSTTQTVVGKSLAKAFIRSQSANNTLLLDTGTAINNAGILSGLNINSTVIPAGWNRAVSSYNQSNGTLILTNPIPTLPTYRTASAYPPIYFTNSLNTQPINIYSGTASNSKIITISPAFTTTDIYPDMIVSNVSIIPYNWNIYVTSVANTTTIVVSVPVTLNNTLLTFTPAKIYNVYGSSSAGTITPYLGHSNFNATRIA
jgi:hypothetical protein